jgi:hypothetical protein
MIALMPGLKTPLDTQTKLEGVFDIKQAFKQT